MLGYVDHQFGRKTRCEKPVTKLVYDHKVFAIIVCGCSNATLAARPEIEKAGVAAVADGIVDPSATNICTSPP